MSYTITKPLMTAKKHWIVYVTPVLLLITGIALLTENDFAIKIIGAATVLSSSIYIAIKASVTWHLTHDYLVIKSGLGPGKKHRQIHLYEIYESAASLNKLQRLVSSGTIRTRRRYENFSLKHSNIANAKELAERINAQVQKHPGYDLNKIYTLKEQGIISEHEYNVMKLGYVTKHHLA